jgi:transcriptional regulator with XRE-family HTH domain
MEKIKLLEARKNRGYSQNQMAEFLFMDISSYNRREKGQMKISVPEWEKLSEILKVPLEAIYESEDSQVFICKDNATVNYQGNNTIYSVPEFLLESQQKYIKKLEEEIAQLRAMLNIDTDKQD